MKIMHSLLYLVVILIGLVGQYAHSCPLCVGKIEENSPTFFSDEYYQTAETDTKQKPLAQSEAKQITPQQTIQEVQA